MRHFIIAASAVSPRSLGVGMTPALTGLVTLPGGTLGTAARGLRTIRRAVNLAAITTATKYCLRQAAPTQEEAPHGVHRLAPASRRDQQTAAPTSWDTWATYLLGRV